VSDFNCMKTRKRAALIHAWADGAIIQYQNTLMQWRDYGNKETPEFIDDSINLRIKPKKTTIRFRLYHIKGVIGVWVEGVQGIPGNAELIDKDWREVEIEL